MAHFAQLNGNSTVIQVIVVHNNDCQVDGVEREEAGVIFCKSLFGTETNWKQTSYNGNIRKNYAGIGFSYDEVRDAFIPPKPFPSWVLDEGTCLWGSPVPMPSEGDQYSWNESLKQWEKR